MRSSDSLGCISEDTDIHKTVAPREQRGAERTLEAIMLKTISNLLELLNLFNQEFIEL